ncbi:heme exporter protein CcmB [Solilutibacter silvestris]|uniref:Heme exporter protein B n=1 Tax=Solilutibacter silvestris TaxID=1645665 RepID=A0A2K1PZL8_9GAMM|nr:heme exporter protein CcmB [Lysobacter silvestris]PNS08230.1 ccmB: heme exporter protein CcmB [Lysobacter silvestris]
MTVAAMFPAIRAILLRDLRLIWRKRGDALQPVLFALLVVVLFALGIDTHSAAMAQSAPAVIWLAALLSGLLALDALFRGDAEDGSLEQWLLSPQPLSLLVAVRVFTHWMTTALPIILVTPLLAELLHLPHAQLPVLMASLLLGTPLLSLVGAVVAALTVGIRRAGALLALIALPLYVPVLVFGAGSVVASAQGLDASGALLILAAMLVVSLVVAPVVAAAALRIGWR